MRAVVWIGAIAVSWVAVYLVYQILKTTLLLGQLVGS